MEKLKVVVRIRPFLPNENNSNTGLNIDPKNSSTIEISKSLKKFTATFDKILSQESTQKDVFKFIKPCMTYIKEGKNCTILAYGQTGSGKTYTMFGGEWAMNDKSTDYEIRKKFNKDKYNFILNEELTIDPFSKTNGIIPNLIMSLFQSYGSFGTNDNNMIITCSYIQIYNEQVYDLLIEEDEKIEEKKDFNLISAVGKKIVEKPIKQKPLKIKYDKKTGVTIEGVNEIRTPTFYDIFELLRQGEINRKIRQTNRNEMSSRSHTIFIINIQNIKSNVVSKIKLCDLAGSERYDSRESYKKLHFNEMCNINKSLLVLGNVIHSLGQINSNANAKSPNKTNKKNAKTFAPYKDSKLTQILEDSIGGNSVTYLIANISPCTENFEETISTLKFADRAHSIMSEVSMNQLDNKDESVNSKEFNKIREELYQLKQLLNIRRKRGTLEPIQEELLKLKDENTQLKKFLGGENNVNKIQELMIENNNLRREIKNLRNINQNLKNEINSKPNSQMSSEFNDNLKNNFSVKRKSKLNNDNNKSSSLKNLNNNNNKNNYLNTVNNIISTPKNSNKNKINKYDIDDMLESNETEKNQNKMSKNNKFQKSEKNVLLESGQNIVYGSNYEKNKNNKEDNELNNVDNYDINNNSKNNKSKKNTNVSKNKNLNQLSDFINSNNPYENLNLLDQIDIGNNNNSDNEEGEEGEEGDEN